MMHPECNYSPLAERPLYPATPAPQCTHNGVARTEKEAIAELNHRHQILHKREAVASAYDQRLSRYSDLTLPPLALANGRISWFVYVVRLAARPGLERDAIIRGLTAAGIGSGRYFAPIHLQPSYAAWRNSTKLAVTEAEAARTLALPFFNNIEAAAIDEVCENLGRLLPGQRG
jgi:perosamine synthetase